MCWRRQGRRQRTADGIVAGLDAPGRVAVRPARVLQDATQYDTTTGLVAEADAVLRNGRVKTIFQGRLIDMPDSRYGVDWAWGDYVTAQAFGQLIDCRIEAVPEWASVLFIDLPAGQVSWHIHESETLWFYFVGAYDGEWDEHTTDEKYQRVLEPGL
jgi:hypothetical protein